MRLSEFNNRQIFLLSITIFSIIWGAIFVISAASGKNLFDFKGFIVSALIFILIPLLFIDRRKSYEEWQKFMKIDFRKYAAIYYFHVILIFIFSSRTIWQEFLVPTIFILGGLAIAIKLALILKAGRQLNPGNFINGIIARTLESFITFSLAILIGYDLSSILLIINNLIYLFPK